MVSIYLFKDNVCKYVPTFFYIDCFGGVNMHVFSFLNVPVYDEKNM